MSNSHFANPKLRWRKRGCFDEAFLSSMSVEMSNFLPNTLTQDFLSFPWDWESLNESGSEPLETPEALNVEYGRKWIHSRNTFVGIWRLLFSAINKYVYSIEDETRGSFRETRELHCAIDIWCPFSEQWALLCWLTVWFTTVRVQPWPKVTCPHPHGNVPSNRTEPGIRPTSSQETGRSRWDNKYPTTCHHKRKKHSSYLHEWQHFSSVHQYFIRRHVQEKKLNFSIFRC